MKTDWNSGMDYGFSTIKTMMWMLGVWPLQHNSLIFTVRWLITFIAESLTMINLLIEPFKNCGDTKDAMELFLIVESSLHAWLNVIFSRIYMKKIAVNVSCAIDDWSSSSMKKESYVIMTEYARAGRIITMSQISIGCAGIIIFFTSIIIGNKQQVVIIDNNTVTLWNFVFPSTCLFKGVSYSTYKALYVMQILQGFLILIAECANDSFFFSITMHLCGQLELLRIRIVEIGRKSHMKNHYANVLGSWIKRHCQLTMLARNIEDAFNIIILLRLLMVTVVIAISGMRTIASFKNRDYNDVMKDMIFVHFFIVQSFLFTHAGDTLQSQSESIVSAIYDTAWHELPCATMKDLVFVMMRTRIPLRLTAGKFFYITRRTTTDILKTALTYVSFLQVAMGK